MSRTTARRLLLTVAISLAIYALSCFSPMSWSPDGRWLAFTTVTMKEVKGPDGKPQTKETYQVLVFEPATQTTKCLAEGWAFSAPVFLPDGKSVVYVECDEEPIEKGKAEPKGVEDAAKKGVKKAEEQPPPKHRCRLARVDVSSGDRRVVAELPPMEVSRDDHDKPATDSIQSLVPAVCPDGKKAAWAVRDRGTSDLLLIDLASGQIKELARGADWPAWSPDGKWVCFLRVVPDGEGPDPLGVFVEAMDPESGRRVILGDFLFESGGLMALSWFRVSWRPDSSGLAYTTAIRPDLDERGQEAVYTADLDGTRTEIVRSSKERVFGNPVWSPDGSKIAICATRFRTNRPDDEMGSTLFILDVKTGKKTILAEAWPAFFEKGPGAPALMVLNMPAWSPDGRWLAVRVSSGDPMLFRTDGKGKIYVTHDPMSALRAGWFGGALTKELVLQKDFAAARKEARETVALLDEWIDKMPNPNAKGDLFEPKAYCLLVLNRFQEICDFAKGEKGAIDDPLGMAWAALGQREGVEGADEEIAEAEELEAKAAKCNDPIQAAYMLLRAGDIWYETLWSKDKSIAAYQKVIDQWPDSPEAKRARKKIAEVKAFFVKE